MTDQELRNLCEHTVAISDNTNNLSKICQACLRLLAERDAMRGILTHARALLVSMGRGEENVYSLCLKNMDALAKLGERRD